MTIIRHTFVAACIFAASIAHAQEDSRVLVIGGSAAEIVAALGEADRLVGRDTTTTYPPELMAVPDVGYVRALAPEGILSVEPDLIIAEADAGPIETVDLMQSADIPWITLPEAHDPSGVAAKILAVGDALGVPDEATALAAKVEAEIAAAVDLSENVSVAERPRVLFILSLAGGRIMAAGEESSASGIIDLAGGVNALEGFTGYKQVTDEAVSAAAPDIILMMDRAGDHSMADADIFALPALATSPAAETQNVVRMDGLLLLGFGPRTGQAIRDLHAAFYGTANGG